MTRRNNPGVLPEQIASGAATVSTTTALMPFADLQAYRTLLFRVTNLDGSNSVTFRVRPSEDGTHPNTERAHEATVAAGAEGDIEIGPDQIRHYWELDAYSQAPTYPSVSVEWSVVGLRRLHFGASER